MAGAFGDVTEPVEPGPGALGVDVVRGNGRHAAPVVDAGVQQDPEVVGQVGRGLQMDLGGQNQPGHGDGPEELFRRAGRSLGHGGTQLGQEVLDDHLLDVAVTAVRSCDRFERVDPVLAGLADADEDAAGERDLQLTGRFEGGEPTGRLFVGSAAVAGQVPVERLEHHPLAGAVGPQRGQVRRGGGRQRWRGAAAPSLSRTSLAISAR